MEAQNCFICNSVSVFYSRNLFKIKSKHSQTRLCDFIAKILGHLPTNDESNAIDSDENFVCFECLSKIDDYDLACETAKKAESELRELLLTAEKLRLHSLKLEDIKEVLTPSIESAVIKEEKFKIEDLVTETVSIHSDSGSNPDNNDVYDEDYVPSKSTSPVKQKKKVSIKLGGDEPTDQEYLCNICDEVFRSLSALLQHSHRRTKASKGVKTGPYIYMCIACKKKFRTKLSHDHHMKQHREDTLARTKLLREQSTKEEEDQFKCSVCGLDLKEEIALNEHKELHLDAPPTQCVLCSKVFKQKGALVRHMRIHSGDKFYQCDRCGKGFVHKSSFQMHILAHDDIRKKQCPHCSQMFRSSSHLNRHIRIHTGAKPYSCPICGQKFAQRYNMSVHQRLHDSSLEKRRSDKIHLCNFCGSTFARKSKLEEHLQKNHEAVIPHTSIGNHLNETNKIRTNTSS